MEVEIRAWRERLNKLLRTNTRKGLRVGTRSPAAASVVREASVITVGRGLMTKSFSMDLSSFKVVYQPSPANTGSFVVLKSVDIESFEMTDHIKSVCKRSALIERLKCCCYKIILNREKTRPRKKEREINLMYIIKETTVLTSVLKWI